MSKHAKQENVEDGLVAGGNPSPSASVALHAGVTNEGEPRERARHAGVAKQGEFGLYRVPDLAKSEELIRVRKKRRAPRGGKRALKITLAAVGVLAVAVCAAAFAFVASVNSAMSLGNKEDEQKLREVLAPVSSDAKEKPFYVLLLGSDARENDVVSRSDVIILTRVDVENAQVTMVSIPRDTMVDLPGYGRSKINAAYAYDGAAGAVQAVSQFSGVPIAHYAEIHFEGLEQLVDNLGGIWVDVPVSNNETGSLNTNVRIDAGEQLLNGKQALAFARERYGYARGDFQRADNQRLVVQAIIKQMLAASPVDLPGIVQQAAGCVSTDMGVGDVVQLAQRFQQAGSLKVYSALVPSETMTLDSVSYAITDTTAWTLMMKRVNAGEDPNAQDVSGADADGDADSDAAANASAGAADAAHAVAEAGASDAASANEEER